MKEIYGFTASGGGAKGAWGGGVAEYLVNTLNRDYSYLSGTSTGALIMSMVASGKMTELKEAYTSVTNDSIYTLCPYRIVETKHGNFKTKLNYFKIAWNMLIKKQKTFGDSTKLREEILPKFFKSDDFYQIRNHHKEMIAATTNLTLGETEYKSSMDEDMTYEDFLDWVFASTCAAPFMSIVSKDGYEYADGGYIEHVPIQILINRGCTVIDVIDHKSPDFPIEKIRNPLHTINRIIDIAMWETAISDLALTKLKAAEHDVKINIYSPNRRLTNNSLVFDKEIMTEWWDEGYKYAENKECCKSYVLRKGRKPKLIID